MQDTDPTHKTEYREWKLKRMGEKAFNLLMMRAHTPGKTRPQLMFIRELMKEQT